MERIRRGELWLDTTYPEWFKRIDLKRRPFDMAGSHTCVVGIVLGLTRWKELLVRHPEIGSSMYELMSWSTDHGFATDIWGCGDYDPLTKAWRAIIVARQAKK